MIVVDSSGWLQFLTDGPLANEYAKRLRQRATIITPTIVIYEVYKHSKRLRGEEGALDAVARDAEDARRSAERRAGSRRR